MTLGATFCFNWDHTEKLIPLKDISYMPLSETDPGYRDIISVLEFTDSVFEDWICLRLFGDSRGKSRPFLTRDRKVSVTQSCPTLCDSVGSSPQGSSVCGILQQEYWSGLPCPSPRDRKYGSCLGKCPLEPSLVAQTIKRLPTMWETEVRSLGWEDPLEKEMATHSSTLAWKIPWMEEHGRLQSMGSQRIGHDWVTSLHFTSLRLKKRSDPT